MALTLPPCGRVLDGFECTEVGDHFCEPRADHVVKFIEELLVHTKGSYARRKFKLAAWQRDEIVRPLFGRVVWSDEHGQYKRQYETAWLEVSRKQGKTELLAALMLYILLAEGEFSAELYSVAKDIKQARLCFDVAAQMVRLNPVLSKRCKVLNSAKRIVKLDSNSVYAVIAADAGAALGSNPSAVAADEILAWTSSGQELWDALATGQGSMARVQPLMIAATTAGSDSESFGGIKHAEMVKVADDPDSAPHVFTFIRNTPRDADPFDEKNWYYANPALGDFLSLEKMRKFAADARRNPMALRGFQQFNLNQWVSSSVSWCPMHLYDDCKGDEFEYGQQAREAFTGRECWFGLDLAARQDLCAMAYLFPDGDSFDLLWRFWIPEAQFWKLDKANSGRFTIWAKKGWIQTTEGEVLDFQQVYEDIEADARRFVILGGDADKWSSDPVIQEVGRRTYISDIYSYDNQFRHVSDSMHRTFEAITEKKLRHHGNPVARWCFDACEARIAPYNPDLIRPDKPNRQKTVKRIDAVSSTIMAVNAWSVRGNDSDSVYSSSDVMTVNF